MAGFSWTIFAQGLSGSCSTRATSLSRLTHLSSSWAGKTQTAEAPWAFLSVCMPGLSSKAASGWVNFFQGGSGLQRPVSLVKSQVESTLCFLAGLTSQHSHKGPPSFQGRRQAPPGDERCTKESADVFSNQHRISQTSGRKSGTE